MDQTVIVPKVSFLINLGSCEAEGANVARLRHLVHLFRGHRLPATWSASGAHCAQLLQDQSSSVTQEMALIVDPSWSALQISAKRFRDELCRRLQSLAGCRGVSPSLVTGDSALLRSRANLLAKQGIQAIVTELPARGSSAKPRPLPCGLWQLAANVRIPQRRLSFRWLPMRRISVKQLVTPPYAASGAIVLVESEELQRISARGLQSFEKLLREVSWYASRRQLVVSTISEIVAELATHHEVKPQRSILRVAA